MLAVLVRALLERLGRRHGLARSADQLLAAFAGLPAVDLLWAAGSTQRRVAEVTPFQGQVLQVLGWPLPEQYAAGAPTPR
jgi:hypothetical protein